MEAAGFRVSGAKLHTVAPSFERKEHYEAFLETVILRQPLAMLPESVRSEFLEAVSRRTREDEGAYTLDYVRLTVRSRSLRSRS